MRRWVAVAIAIALCFYPPWLRAESPQVTAQWTAPTSGSPVALYVLQVYTGEDLFLEVTSDSTQYIFAPGTFQVDVPYVARVKGVDARDRSGPWSEWSEAYVWDPGPPSACGPINWIVGG